MMLKLRPTEYLCYASCFTALLSQISRELDILIDILIIYSTVSRLQCICLGNTIHPAKGAVNKGVRQGGPLRLRLDLPPAASSCYYAVPWYYHTASLGWTCTSWRIKRREYPKQDMAVTLLSKMSNLVGIPMGCRCRMAMELHEPGLLLIASFLHVRKEKVRDMSPEFHSRQLKFSFPARHTLTNHGELTLGSSQTSAGVWGPSTFQSAS